MNIELITCECGDWEVLIIDGGIRYQGHSIPEYVWLNILKENTDNEIIEREISDEDMEEGNY